MTDSDQQIADALRTRVISKFTLIPVSAVIAAITITILVMTSIQQRESGYADRLLIAETQIKQTQREMEDLRHSISDMNAKLDTTSKALSTINESLVLIRWKMGIDKDVPK